MGRGDHRDDANHRPEMDELDIFRCRRNWLGRSAKAGVQLDEFGSGRLGVDFRPIAIALVFARAFA